MIAPEAAWEKLEELLVARVPAASEPLARDEARGRRLASDLAATTDVPSSDISALDGFAFAGDPSSGDLFDVAGRALAGAPAALDPAPLSGPPAAS